MVLIMFWYCRSNLRQKPQVNRSGSPPMWDVFFSLKTVSFRCNGGLPKVKWYASIGCHAPSPHGFLLVLLRFWDVWMYMFVYVVVQSILQYYLDRHLVWKITSSHTVDGRNPADKLIGSLSHYLQGFLHPRWLAGFLNHQQQITLEAVKISPPRWFFSR